MECNVLFWYIYFICILFLKLRGRIQVYPRVADKKKILKYGPVGKEKEIECPYMYMYIYMRGTGLTTSALLSKVP